MSEAIATCPQWSVNDKREDPRLPAKINDRRDPRKAVRNPWYLKRRRPYLSLRPKNRAPQPGALKKDAIGAAQTTVETADAENSRPRQTARQEGAVHAHLNPWRKHRSVPSLS